MSSCGITCQIQRSFTCTNVAEILQYEHPAVSSHGGSHARINSDLAAVVCCVNQLTIPMAVLNQVSFEGFHHRGRCQHKFINRLPNYLFGSPSEYKLRTMVPAANYA